MDGGGQSSIDRGDDSTLMLPLPLLQPFLGNQCTSGALHRASNLTLHKDIFLGTDDKAHRSQIIADTSAANTSITINMSESNDIQTDIPSLPEDVQLIYVAEGVVYLDPAKFLSKIIAENIH